MALALGVFRVMGWDVRCSGEENVPIEGPAIIASNHIGPIDFVFLGAAARERSRLVRFMGLQEAFDHRMSGPLLRGMHHIPVDRSGDPAASLDAAIAALRRGEVVGLHPEGKMSRSFVPIDAKTGAARLAIETGAPLIPAAAWGSQRILGQGRRPRFPRGIAIVTAFGPPVPAAPDDDPAAVTVTLMARITELLADVMAAYPQRPRGPDDRWWVPAHLGGTAPTVAEAAAASAARARPR